MSIISEFYYSGFKKNELRNDQGYFLSSVLEQWVLQFFAELQIPVHCGCDQPLIMETGRVPFTAYHGNDGLGDVSDGDLISDGVIENQHAVNYLVDKVATNPSKQ